MEMHYHAICRTRYQTRAEQTTQGKEEKELYRAKTKESSEWHRSRDIHNKAFDSICDMIEKNVISNNEVQLMSELNNHYIDRKHKGE